MRNQKGSGLLLTLLFSVLGALLIGIAIDAAYLICVRMNLQNAVDLGADAVLVELRSRPDADQASLEDAAHASLGRNMRQWRRDPGRLRLTREADRWILRAHLDTGVFFLRAIYSEPIRVEAAAVMK